MVWPVSAFLNVGIRLLQEAKKNLGKTACNTTPGFNWHLKSAGCSSGTRLSIGIFVARRAEFDFCLPSKRTVKSKNHHKCLKH